jgi:hypothetical protein
MHLRSIWCSYQLVLILYPIEIKSSLISMHAAKLAVHLDSLLFQGDKLFIESNARIFSIRKGKVAIVKKCNP